MAKISIIIPVYNTEEWLHDCLTSVKNQSLTDWEAIIIDDFSSDDSKKIAKEFCDIDIRFKLVELEKNLGLGGARNVGCQIAKGEYLLFLDSDDLLPRSNLEVMYNRVKDFDADILIGDFYEFPCGKSVPSTDQTYSASESFHIAFDKLPEVLTWREMAHNYDLIMPSIFTTTCCGKLFNRRLWNDLNCHVPGNLRMAEDFIPVKKIIFNAKRIVPINLSVILYRKRKNSATTKRSNKAYEILRSYNFARKEFESFLLEQDFREFFEIFYIRSIREHMYSFLQYRYWFSYYRQASFIFLSLNITRKQLVFDGINLRGWANAEKSTFLRLIYIFLVRKIKLFFRGY